MLFPKFKKIIDSCDEPLVGAEYIIEMEQFDLNSCSGHLCLLCNIEKKKKLWDGRELKVHLLSNHHRLKFLVIIIHHDSGVARNFEGWRIKKRLEN